MKEDPKRKNMGHSWSLALSPFDTAHTPFYSPFTNATYLSRAISRYTKLFVESH